MRYFIFQLILFLLFDCASAQKMMNLDRDLKANSEALLVKTKGAVGFGSMLKYEFGPYKVISAKEGRGSSTFKSKFFSKIEKSESKQNVSIVLVSNEKDTIEVDIAINVTSEGIRENYLEFGKDRMSFNSREELSSRKSTKNIVASISQSGDTTAWGMVYTLRVNSDSSLNTNRSGFLSDKNMTIEIGEINNWEDGKSQFGYPIGDEFYFNGKAIAAVQSSLDSFKKNIIWFQNGLDKK